MIQHFTMRHFGLACITLAACCGCTRLDRIPYEPPLPAAAWCAGQPCITVGNVVISQPSSSVIVYVLALLSIAVAFHFLRTHSSQRSRWWWGISLLLGGIGALLAGTSYQAFGYEIKCAGREFCKWTSWWEIGYEMFTVAGAGALLIAVAYSCFSKRWQNVCRIYAAVNTTVYFIIVFTGALLPDRFMVSFELMLLFTAPAYAVVLVINAWQFYRNGNKLLRAYIGAWVLLFATLGAYYWYMTAGITQSLWSQGMWFSENDVLHVGMIVWILYVFQILGKSIRDGVLQYNKSTFSKPFTPV